MAKKVPFPFVQALPDRAVFELERNFQYLADQFISTVTGWDAIVDPTLTADDTVNLQFKTVFAAVKYVADTLGRTNMTIGVRPTTTTIVETGNYSGSTSSLTIRLIGMGGNFATDAGGTPNGKIPLWDMHLFHENSKWSNLIVGAMFVQKNGGTVTPGSAFFNSTSLRVYATDSVFDGQGASSTTVTCDISNLIADNCTLLDVGSQTSMVLRNCTISIVRPTTLGWACSLVAQSCIIAPPSSNCTLTLSATTFITIDGTTTGASASAILTLTVSAAKQVSFKMHVNSATTLGLALNITSASLQQLLIEGYYNEITTVAPTTGNGVGMIHASVKNRADITGPANVALTIHDGTALTTYGVRIRGAVTGTITARVADTVTAVTVLDFILAKRCVIAASIKLDGAASTGCKAYNFDATSANNILILEADAVGGVSADAGANDLVITDATFGSSPTTATIDADFSHDFMMGTL